jgi:hypothetical protein
MSEELIIYLLKTYTIPTLVIIGFVVLFIHIILHPQIVLEWNAQWHIWKAKFRPYMRKRAYEKVVNSDLYFTLHKAQTEGGLNFSRQLPKELKIQWVN